MCLSIGLFAYQLIDLWWASTPPLVVLVGVFTPPLDRTPPPNCSRQTLGDPSLPPRHHPPKHTGNPPCYPSTDIQYIKKWTLSRMNSGVTGQGSMVHRRKPVVAGVRKTRRTAKEEGGGARTEDTYDCAGRPGMLCRGGGLTGDIGGPFVGEYGFWPDVLWQCCCAVASGQNLNPTAPFLRRL